MDKQKPSRKNPLSIKPAFDLEKERFLEPLGGSNPSLSLDELSPPTGTTPPSQRNSLMGAAATNSPNIASLEALGITNFEQGGLVTHYKKGVKLYKQEKYQEAIAEFDEALKFSEEYANAHYNKGLALKTLGRYDESMIEYERALELKPNNILYLCSQARLYLVQDDKDSALECFNRAYEISAAGTPKGSYTEANLEFVHRTLQERAELLEKIRNIQSTSIESQKIINAYLDKEHPAFHNAVEHFTHLRNLKLSLLEKFMDSIHQDDPSSVVDFAVPAHEIVRQLSSHQADSGKSELVHHLCDNIHELKAQISKLENEFVTQQEEFTRMLQDQEHLQAKTAEQDMMLEHHDAQIQRLEDFAEAFKIKQSDLEDVVVKMRAKGAEDTTRMLNQISVLQRNLVGILPVDFDLDEYQSGFFYTLKQDLIAAQFAASLVTNTNIIRNSKTGPAGKMGDVLDVAGDVLPTIGGLVQFFAAMINTADHAHQQVLVGKLAGIARTPSEMERIAHTVAKILSNPQYFDRSMIETHPQTLKSKLVGYVSSFIEELSDGTQSSTVHAVEGRVVHPKTPTKQTKSVLHLRHKSEPNPHDESTPDASDEASTKSSRGLSIFSRKSKHKDSNVKQTKTMSASDKDDATVTDSSTQSFDFMHRGASESATQSDLPVRGIHHKKSFFSLSSFRKTPTKDDAPVISPEEQTGIDNAHIVSKTIIKLMYDGKIPGRSMQVSEHLIVEKILTATFTKLDLDPSMATTALSEEQVFAIDMSPRSNTSPEPLSANKLEAQKLASEILDEVASQVGLSDDLYNTAFHALTSRIDTCYSSAKIPIIESMMKSSGFKGAFIDRLVATIVKQIRQTEDHEITLDSVRAAIKDTEAALRDEGDDFLINGSREVLVWQCLIEPDNPFLQDPNFMQQAMKIISSEESSKLLTLGTEDPQKARILLQGMKTHGMKTILDMMFSHNAVSPEASAIAGDVIAEHSGAEEMA